MFKIGDIVEPLESSNSRYLITTKRNGFIGKVVSVYDNYLTLKTIEAIDGRDRGVKFNVCSKYFTLHKNNKTTLNRLRGRSNES